MKAFYINEHGTKTSKKLDKITSAAWDYIWGGKGYDIKKFETKKFQALRRRFDIEAEAIGGVWYGIGDSVC